ncbi:hypothetical protein T4D_1474 [Trichinella pseudospiralis]|uniref:Uncharacterized protein n=1 Tax=Trichinella pseudospiralis TaxID=6337 RepID=A0A0V1FU35_TRIPS|nr:hypothetical protein T4D_1474 [Trichinella pseudospiralis]
MYLCLHDFVINDGCVSSLLNMLMICYTNRIEAVFNGSLLNEELRRQVSPGFIKLILNGMSTVVRSDDTEVLLCIICSSPLYGFYIVSDERLKSTVGCSDNISSLFMVALGAGTTQVQIIALKYLDIPQMRISNVQAADSVVSYVPDDSWSLLWSGTLVLWSLLCSHTARSGSWTGSRGCFNRDSPSWYVVIVNSHRILYPSCWCESIKRRKYQPQATPPGVASEHKKFAYANFHIA